MIAKVTTRPQGWADMDTWQLLLLGMQPGPCSEGVPRALRQLSLRLGHVELLR